MIHRFVTFAVLATIHLSRFSAFAVLVLFATLSGCAGNPGPMPGSCPAAAPIDCGTTIPDACCPGAQPICCARDQSCHETAADCAAVCLGSGGTCQTSADCCTGLVCGRRATFCQVAKNLDIGDPCTASAQCLPGLVCDPAARYCTKSCNDSLQCGAQTCMVTTRGFQCAPDCTDKTDCAGTGLSCRASTDPGGQAVKGCF